MKGEAAEDPDFQGRRRPRSVTPFRSERPPGPITVRAELWYQPIAYRWARNVEDRPSAEADLFARYYTPLAGVSGLVLARAEAKIGS